MPCWVGERAVISSSLPGASASNDCNRPEVRFAKGKSEGETVSLTCESPFPANPLRISRNRLARAVAVSFAVQFAAVKPPQMQPTVDHHAVDGENFLSGARHASAGTTILGCNPKTSLLLFLIVKTAQVIEHHFGFRMGKGIIPLATEVAEDAVTHPFFGNPTKATLQPPAKPG